MKLEAGKVYKYIGRSTTYKNKIYKCCEITPLGNAKFFKMLSFTFLSNGKSRYHDDYLWEEVSQPKPKMITYWK